MSSSYTEVFGGENIHAASVDYQPYEISADLQLVWPFEATEDSDIAASKIDVSATAAGLKVFMPPADLESVGQDILISNVGSNAFTVVDYLGNTIIAIPPGQQWFLYLVDNSTSVGAWRIVIFGSVTSPLTASALAGFGLRARAEKLDQNLPTIVINGDYLFGTSDRAEVGRSNGGASVWSFRPAAELSNGWMVYLINAGSGLVTLTPTAGQTIDNSGTKGLNPGESCIVFSDGANLWTLGYGRAISSTTTALSLNVAGGPSTIVLTPTQAAAQVQDFNGALLGDQIIDYNSVVGYWFVYNNTTGAFNLHFRARTAPLDAGVVVPQGSFSILRSDGTNLHIAFTATSGTVTRVSSVPDETTGGDITTTGNIGLANIGAPTFPAFVPGNYPATTDLAIRVTVDPKGRVVFIDSYVVQPAFASIGAFSSAALAGKLTDETGHGLAVFNDSPTLIAPVLGAATATSINGSLIPTSAGDTAVLLDAIQTLTQKTLTAPVITGGSVNALTTGVTKTVPIAAGDTTLATNEMIKLAVDAAIAAAVTTRWKYCFAEWTGAGYTLFNSVGIASVQLIGTGVIRVTMDPAQPDNQYIVAALPRGASNYYFNEAADVARTNAAFILYVGGDNIGPQNPTSFNLLIFR